MKMLRIILMAAIAFSMQVYSVNAGNIPVADLTTEWQLDQEVDGVQIYLKKVECNDEINGIYQEVILVKMVNTTGQNLKLEWDMEFWYDGECRTCDPAADSEYHYSVEMIAGAVSEGNCEVDAPRELRYFVRFLNYDHIAKLSKYEMASLGVSPY